MYDGKNGGQCYISIKGMKTNLLLYKSSISFALMGLTDATGNLLLCICILSAKSLSVTDVKLLDYRASIPYDSSNSMEENIVEGKSFPGLTV